VLPGVPPAVTQSVEIVQFLPGFIAPLMDGGDDGPGGMPIPTSRTSENCSGLDGFQHGVVSTKLVPPVGLLCVTRAIVMTSAYAALRSKR
jgi:hypothetical protein